MPALSNEFTLYPVAKIKANRNERQRTAFDPEAMKALRESMDKHGLIHPLVITREGTLIAGESRLICAKRLGWKEIAVQFTNDVDDTTVRLIELEENTRRSDLSWQDRCAAIHDLHELYLQSDPEWTFKATGDIIRASIKYVSQHHRLGKEIKQGNTKISEAATLQNAHSILLKIVEREQQNLPTIAAVTKLPSTTQAEEQTNEAIEPLVERTISIAEANAIPPLINTTFEQFAKDFDGTRFNFLHCDFPYGVNVGAGSKASTATYGDYDDSPDVYWNLIATLARNMDKLIADSAHIMFWFAMSNYQKTLTALTKMGWNINPYPLIWGKTDNRGIVPDSNRYGRRIYETAFFGSRGDRKINKVVNNAFYGPNINVAGHPSAKPAPMLKHFFSAFVDEYTIMLDPTCGGASSVFTSKRLGAKYSLGVEADPTFYKRAYENFWEHS